MSVAPTSILREQTTTLAQDTKKSKAIAKNRAYVTAYIAEHPSIAFHPKKKPVNASSEESLLNILDLHEDILIKIFFYSSCSTINNLRLANRTFRDLSRKPKAGLKQYRILDRYDSICEKLKVDIVIRPHNDVIYFVQIGAVDLQGDASGLISVKKELQVKVESTNSTMAVTALRRQALSQQSIIKSDSQENLINAGKNGIISLGYRLHSCNGDEGLYQRDFCIVNSFETNCDPIQKKIMTAVNDFSQSQIIQNTEPQTATAQDIKDSWKVRPPGLLELIFGVFYVTVRPIKSTTSEAYDKKHQPT